MSEERILVVTVGTSLFSSASWSYEGDLKSVRGYRGWTEELLEDPARRRRQSTTSEEVEKLLRREGSKVTEKYFEQDFDHSLRYSGELTTLLRCSQRFGERDVAAFLRRSYQEVQLLAATKKGDSSNVAAQHLQVILSDKLGHPKVTMPETLTSTHLSEMVRHLRDHLANLDRAGAEVDLLVTGGYKIYSLLAGKFVAMQREGRIWRALYIHEEQESQLIIETRDAIEIDKTTKIVVRDTDWSPPAGQQR